MQLVLNPQTSKQIDNFLANASHALLIQGPPGSGKSTIANYIAAKLTNNSPEQIDNYSFFMRVVPKDQVIPIDDVRKAQQFMRLKTIGDNQLRRALVIEDAHYLTTEAQNAFLKLLEEPPTDTIIILTASKGRKLLPTINSRVQHIDIKAPSKDLVVAHFSSLGSKSAEIEKSYYIAEGQMGLMTALLESSSEHPLNSSITEAKELISSSSFERLSKIDKLNKQKEHLPELFYALERVYKAVLTQASQQGDAAQVKRAHHALKIVLQAEGMLKNNPNTKLLLSDLFLNL